MRHWLPTALLAVVSLPVLAAPPSPADMPAGLFPTRDEHHLKGQPSIVLLVTRFPDGQASFPTGDQYDAEGRLLRHFILSPTRGGQKRYLMKGSFTVLWKDGQPLGVSHLPTGFPENPADHSQDARLRFTRAVKHDEQGRITELESNKPERRPGISSRKPGEPAPAPIELTLTTIRYAPPAAGA